MGFGQVLRPEPVATFALGEALEGNTSDAATSGIQARYGATVSHMKRTQELAGRVAVGLGLSADEIRVVRYAAVVHDVGKLGVPDSILDKPGKLSKLEWVIVRRHAEMGAEMLSWIAGFERVCAVVAAHHERLDGRGYPAGLVGPDIPIEARLISVVDAYDAMTSDRPYRRALSHGRAMEQLDSGAGSQFDSAVVAATKAMLCGNGRGYAAVAGSHPRRRGHAGRQP